MLKSMIAVSIIAAGLVVVGCSSSPSEDEMRQLNQLQDQVRSLQKQVNDRQAEKSALEKQIADKNGKLQQCQADQQAVKSALGK